MEKLTTTLSSQTVSEIEKDFQPDAHSYRWNTAKKDTLGDVIGLTTADMDFPRTPQMQQVIVNFAEKGCLMYPTQHPKLNPVTLRRIHNRYKASNIESEDILFFPSVLTAMNALVWALNPPNTPYTLLTPNYPPLFNLSQPSKILEMPLLDTEHEDPTQRGRIDFAKLKTEMHLRQSKVLVISNPSNPLGKVWQPTEINEIIDFARKNAIHVLSDEIWIDWTFESPATSFAKFITSPTSNHSAILPVESQSQPATKSTAAKQPTTSKSCCNASFDPKKTPAAGISPVEYSTSEISDPTVAVVMATSKTFNIGGLNCAYIITKNKPLKKKLQYYLNFYCTAPSQLAQHMLIHLYEQGDETFHHYKELVRKNRDYLVEFCREKIPQLRLLLGAASHVVWIDASALTTTASNPADFFLKNAKVHLFHGSAFGSQYTKFIRMNIATHPHILAEALNRMHQAIKNSH
ncbi:hypothetical protein COTS27_01480 [Spirochaetota bacterium]|nr:hypothetical protein COTS27_01480 [Spirochaetota bacterium]